MKTRKTASGGPSLKKTRLRRAGSSTSKELKIENAPHDDRHKRMYAGIHRTTAELATVAEVLNPKTPTRTIGEMSHSELVKLVSARVQQDESFLPLYMLGVSGVVNRTRAVEEIEKSSHIGLHLINIEKEYIAIQLRRKQ